MPADPTLQPNPHDVEFQVLRKMNQIASGLVEPDPDLAFNEHDMELTSLRKINQLLWNLLDQGVGGGGVTIGYVDQQDALRLLKAGDTMSGNLAIVKTSAVDTVLILDSQAQDVIDLRWNQINRWRLRRGPLGATNLVLECWSDDNGATIVNVFTVVRSTQVVDFNQIPTVRGIPIAMRDALDALEARVQALESVP